MGPCIKNPIMGTLIDIILHGLCLINEWNAIINLQNDMVKTSRTGPKKIH